MSSLCVAKHRFASVFIFSSSTVLDTYCLYGSLFQLGGILTESASGSHRTLEVSRAGSSRRSRTSSTLRADTLERSEPLNHRKNSSKVGKASFFSSLLGLLKDPETRASWAAFHFPSLLGSHVFCHYESEII